MIKQYHGDELKETDVGDIQLCRRISNTRIHTTIYKHRPSPHHLRAKSNMGFRCQNFNTKIQRIIE